MTHLQAVTAFVHPTRLQWPPSSYDFRDPPQPIAATLSATKVGKRRGTRIHGAHLWTTRNVWSWHGVLTMCLRRRLLLSLLMLLLMKREGLSGRDYYCRSQLLRVGELWSYLHFIWVRRFACMKATSFYEVAPNPFLISPWESIGIHQRHTPTTLCCTLVSWTSGLAVLGHHPTPKQIHSGLVATLHFNAQDPAVS